MRKARRPVQIRDLAITVEKMATRLNVSPRRPVPSYSCLTGRFSHRTPCRGPKPFARPQHHRVRCRVTGSLRSRMILLPVNLPSTIILRGRTSRDKPYA